MSEPTVGSRIRVLVVDDLEELAETLVALLEEFGYEARYVLNGPVALEMVDAFDPHTVLLDIRMPGMDGLELSRRLREQRGRRLQLIGMSGYTLRASDAYETMGILDHFVKKPIDMDELERLLP